jgi:hypothetical protein
MKRCRAAGALLLLFAGLMPAAARRVIIFKFDGLNADFVAKEMAEMNPHTGRPQLPWMAEIFSRQGTCVANFFVRGISLSAPSWAMLDTGHHQAIRGNVEYDRWTLYPYDYLNFFPFYVNYSEDKQVDMPGVEVLDQSHIPLLIDAFQPVQRRQSYQLYQRGNDWNILRLSVPRHFGARSPKEWFDEWQTGLELAGSIPEEAERELIEALADERVTYLDFFSGDYDHTAHLTNDPESQLRSLQSLDALVGRIYTAARAAKLGPETLFVMVSDHGMNTSPEILSQGYSLVNWFNSTAGGAQHVVTDRYPLSTFKLMGLDPWVHRVVTPSSESTYLKSDPQHYPTVVLDVDGNERAGVQLRSSDWNIAQVLLAQIDRPHLSQEMARECRRQLDYWAELRRPQWAVEKARLNGELTAFEQVAETAAHAHGPGLEVRRTKVRGAEMRQAVHDYRDFIAAMDAFLAMPPDAKPSLVPKECLGDPNTLYDLQNYVVGPAEGGLVLGANGRLDLERSFRRIDYFAALRDIHVHNQVQAGISNRPVDFIAAKVDASTIWLYASEEHQALVQYRETGDRFELRYVPIAHLRASKSGEVHYDAAPWGPGFPLAIFEDAGAQPDWHTDREWLGMLCHSRYTNGLIGLTELFRPLQYGEGTLELEKRRRELVQPDFEIFAADHWNFNSRNFNPGGNHGSFFRQSTHSVLMFSGAGVLPGQVIEEPYDSLNFVPTILHLLGLPGATPLPAEPIIK